MFAAFPAPKTATLRLDRLAGILLLAAGIVVVAIRAGVAVDLPLWIDETWSAMIASRPDWPSFWREAWLDCNPPLYYLFLAVWIELAGDSNLALRLPSIAFVVAAAAVPLVWRLPGLSRTGRRAWAAFILLWPFGVYLMLDARGYGLLLLLATLSCVAVTRLLEHLTMRRVAAWVAIGTMMFLTHYYSAALIAAQGLVLLYRHRGSLLRMWPALLIAAPGFAWFAGHLPRLQDYARPDVVWYEASDLGATAQYFAYVAGAANAASLIAITVVAGMALLAMARRRSPDEPTENRTNLVLTASTALIGFAIATSVGLLQPSLTERYFVPLVPPAMLALALATQRCSRQELAVLVLAAAFALPGLDPSVTGQLARQRAIYGIEEASAFVARQQPDRLQFVWDHPAAKILDRHSLEGVGSYFMDRAGLKVPTSALVVPATANANTLIAADAAGNRPAVIWLYNTARRSAAAAHPPALGDDPSWNCRHAHRPTRGGELGSIACVKLGDRQ